MAEAVQSVSYTDYERYVLGANQAVRPGTLQLLSEAEYNEWIENMTDAEQQRAFDLIRRTLESTE